MTNGDFSDSALSSVAEQLRGADPNGLRIAQIVRDTFDQLYDGQRTGRYKFDQLYKTEKTHYGTLIEINLQKEFKFCDGEVLDYRIANVEVDCKYSGTMNGWMIPPEAVGHICLLVSAEDTATPRFSAGLVRATSERLNSGGNRDAKATLNRLGRAAIRWIFREQPIPANVLLQIDEQVVRRIMALKSGQQRINELFRVTLGRTVGRAVVATVAQQDDYMKRVRANRGARTALKPEGIIILGQYESHAEIAKMLGLNVPGRGESISARVVPVRERAPGTAIISGKFWRLAMKTDPVVIAPDLPEI